MKHIIIVSVLIFVVLLPAVAEPKSNPVTTMQEIKIANDHEYNTVFKLSTSDEFGFIRLKKDPDKEPVALDLDDRATTQDFAVRSWGLRTTHFIVGALQHRGFASELRNPLFTVDNPFMTLRPPGLRGETILYTAAVSKKHTAASFRVGSNAFLIQGAYSLDTKNRTWVSGQYLTGNEERRIVTELFAGTHTDNLPEGAKWQKLYPQFGEARTYFPAVSLAYAGPLFSIKCSGAWDVRDGHQPEYLGKGQVSLTFPYFMLTAGFYKGSTAMRSFSAEFPGRDNQLLLNLQAGTKRFRCGLIGNMETKTEDTMKNDQTFYWKTGCNVQIIPPNSKIFFQAFFSGGAEEDPRTLTLLGTALYRGIIAKQDMLSFSPKIQWKQEATVQPLYVYIYQGTLLYTASVSRIFSVNVSLSGGTKNLKTKPYSFVTPKAECRIHFNTKIITADITAGLAYENKFFADATITEPAEVTWYTAVKITEKWNR